MRIMIMTTFAAALLAAGCSSPFTDAAGKFAKAAPDGTPALGNAPSTASGICLKEARLAYLKDHVLSGSTVPWNDYYRTKKVNPDKDRTWEKYCAELDAAGKVFSVGVAALDRYGKALKTLADGGTYDGGSIKDLSDSVSGITASLGASKASEAIKPVGGLLASFGGLIVQRYTEGQIKSYVARADPMVQPIFTSLVGYADALDRDVLAAAEESQRITIKIIEDRAALLGQPADPAKAVEFYRFAVAMDDDIRATRAVLAGYRDVLAQMKSAHGDLTKAAQAPDNPDDLKNALTAISNLIKQLQALQSALAKKE